MTLTERRLYIATIIVLTLAVVVLASAVARLENYRYANFIGICEPAKVPANTETDIVTAARQRLARDKCLETTPTRTHWFWNIVYGVGLL
jgi:hypothetical protein